jgi:hypothetical protein
VCGKKALFCSSRECKGKQQQQQSSIQTCSHPWSCYPRFKVVGAREIDGAGPRTPRKKLEPEMGGMTLAKATPVVARC